jgi:hypothetical protein
LIALGRWSQSGRLRRAPELAETGDDDVTTRRRKRPSGGPTIPESARRERGQEQLRARVSAAVHGAYEREAERRGIALAALVREQLERAEWAREDGET